MFLGCIPATLFWRQSLVHFLGAFPAEAVGPDLSEQTKLFGKGAWESSSESNLSWLNFFIEF